MEISATGRKPRRVNKTVPSVEIARADSAVAVDSFSGPGLGDGARELDASARRHVMSVGNGSIGNNVRRAGSSFLPRPYCHFALQHGPAPNIAHSFFANSQSHLARVGTWAISSASAELQTGAQSQLSFRYFAFLTL